MRRQTDLVVSRRENAYRLSFQGEASFLGYALYPGDAPRPLPDVPGNECYVRMPEAHRRPYFVLGRAGRADVFAADVAVEVPSVENFRDMGGYLTREGRVVRWGRFFRSGALQCLSEEDLQLLAATHLRYVVDYRSDFEAQRTPDMLPAGAEYLHIPAIGSGNPQVRSLAETDLLAQLRQVQDPAQMQEVLSAFVMLYQELPFDNPSYRQMLGTLDTLADGAMLQHCSAGKDRTGVGCALVLLALGVDEETVMQDYLLSSVFRENHNRRLLEKLAASGISSEIIQALSGMLDVSRELLQHTFTAIKTKYGDYPRYFREEYGIDEAHLAAWREMHTLPVD